MSSDLLPVAYHATACPIHDRYIMFRQWDIFHKIHGWPDPTRDFVVAKLLTGCRRDKLGSDKMGANDLICIEPYNERFATGVSHCL